MKKLTLALLSVLAFGSLQPLRILSLFTDASTSASVFQESMTVSVQREQCSDGYRRRYVQSYRYQRRRRFRRGYKIKFVLENGFDADTGAEATEGLAFSREATLQIVSPFGTLAAGRSSILGTDGGSFNMLGNVNPFGTGIWELGNQNIVYGKMPASRFDNAFTYRSPEYRGLQLTTEYSMGEEGKENRSTSNHYFGLGVTWKGGLAETVVLFERVNEALTTEKRSPKDMWRITAGGN